MSHSSPPRAEPVVLGTGCIIILCVVSAAASVIENDFVVNGVVPKSRVTRVGVPPAEAPEYPDIPEPLKPEEPE